MKCCKTCKWMEVKPDKIGRRVVRKDRAYRCIYVVPRFKLPDSITKQYRWEKPFQQRGRSHMAGDMGTDCPTWEKFRK